MFLYAGGVCNICNKSLEDGWHGDHVQAFSRGGKTELKNGQALCPNCNLKKSDKEVRNEILENGTDKPKVKD